MVSLIKNKSFSVVMEYWFPFTLVLFICGFYFAPSSKSLNNIYYALILLPLVVLFFKRGSCRERITTFIDHYKLFFLLLFSFLLSSIVNGIEADHLGRELTRMLYVIGFLAAIKVSADKRWPLNINYTTLVFAVACVAGVYSIYWWYQDRPFRVRMNGFGAMENPILLGASYGIMASAAFFKFLKTEGRSGFIYLLPLMIGLVVVVLAKSRGPLLATTVCFVLSILVVRNLRAFVSGVIVVLALVTLFVQFGDEKLASFKMIRPDIWKAVLEKCMDSPLLGYGLQMKEQVETVGKRFHHPHSTYITTLYLGGVVSLVSFLALIVKGIFVEVKNPQLFFWRILLCFGLAYMVVDGSRLFTHPDELWLLFWLPLGVIFALTTPKLEY